MKDEEIKALEKSIVHWKRIYEKAKTVKNIRISDLKKSVLSSYEKEQLKNTYYCFLCKYTNELNLPCTECPMYGHWPTKEEGVSTELCNDDVNSLYAILEEDEFMMHFYNKNYIVNSEQLDYIKTITEAMENRYNELKN